MNIDVFISHHTATCLHVVEGIANKFESHGVRCWYAPRNTTGPYAQSIAEAIDSCKIFLLILNHQSSESFDVKNEINLACERIRRGDDFQILPFRIADDEVSPDVKYYIGRMHWIDAVTPPMEKRMDELLERALLFLNRMPSVELWDVSDQRSAEHRNTAGSFSMGYRNTPDGSCAEPQNVADNHSTASVYIPARSTTVCRITSARMYPNSHFVGRKKELAQIHEILTGTRNKVFIRGMGGMGKSEIAKKYCDDYCGDYDIIKWVTFSDTLQETIASDQLFDIDGMQKADFPEDDERAYFHRKMHLLRSAPRRVLLVIDNFDVDGDPDLEEFCSGDYSVIFTTRIRQETETIPQTEIYPMEEDELLAIFRMDAGRGGGDADEACIREIIRCLQWHTYGVRIAASVMKKQRMKPQEMLSLLRQDAGAAAKRNVKKAESEILERIQKLFDISSLDEESVYILKNLYFMPLGGVPVEQFAEWCEPDGYDSIDLLIDRNWVVHEASTDAIHLHPLISELMAGEATGDLTCCRKMLKNMTEGTDKEKYRPFAEKQMLLNCEMSLYERLPDNTTEKRMALFLAADRLYDVSRYQECITLWKIELYDPKLDEADRACLYHKISHTYLMSEQAEEGLEIALEGWERVKDLPLDQISMKLGHYRWEIYTRMIEANRMLGNYDLAIRLSREDLPNAGRFYVESPEMVKGWARYHLAFSLFCRSQPGDNEEALAVLEEAMQFFWQISNDWSYAFCMNIVGRILAAQGKYEKALETNKQAYEILYPLVGDSPNIGDNMLWRGDIYRAAGDMESATECYEQALSVYRKKNAVIKEKHALDHIGSM